MGDTILFLPEATILLGALVAFAISAFGGTSRQSFVAALIFSTAGAAVSLVYLSQTGEPFFPGIYKVDAFSQLLKLGITVGLWLTLLISSDLGSQRPHTRVDMPIFLFLSALGMMMLVSATELLTLYVALELSAYGLYIASALHQEQRTGSEAAVKYILFGAASSAVSLYGISLIYGVSGTTSIEAIAQLPSSSLLLVGIVLSLSGVFFKLALFPFHAWAPDTYQASSHQAATFIGTASKVAAVGVMARILSFGAADDDRLITVLLVLSVASMTVGNLAALVQKDLKRLLAYSTVAHAGYVMIGFVCATSLGLASSIFYILMYVPVAYCVFLVVAAVGSDGSNPSRSQLAGLYKRSPLLAAALLVGIFGLAGIPPTAGFAGKWFLFAAAIDKGYFGLVVIAAVNATISVYYYLIIIKEAYLAESSEEQNLSVSPTFRVGAMIGIVLVAAIGLYPSPLWELAKAAAASFGG